MNHQANYPRLYAPTGPAAMILPCVILGPMGMLLFGAGLDAVFKTQQLMGLVYCFGGLLIFSFLTFCLTLHIRAQQVWAWHVRTGRIPYFRKGGFLKGALVGGGLGLAIVFGCAVLGWKFAEHRVYGEVATAAFYLAFLWGSVIVVAPALIVGWARRAWERTAPPPN